MRDWIFVDDHCSAIEAVIERGRAGEVYNIGAHNEMTNISVVRSIIRSVSALRPELDISDGLISFVEDRPGHDRRYAIDSSKIRRDLGWRPGVSFADGLDRTIRWYIDNPGWVSSLLNQEYRTYYDQNYGPKIRLR